MDKFVIIDGNSLINRAFYALPLLTNSRGEFSNGVYGFANLLIKAILDIQPKYIAVALDYAHKTFRNKIFENYKGTRKPTPPELKSQFPILRKMLSSMGIKYIEMEGIEADDIIGTLSRKYETQNIILTGDKDCLQLINENTNVWLTKKGITEVKMMDEKTYNEEYGLVPSQVVDLKALMGDASDNIPGVSGIGEKIALSLMQEYGSLDNVYSNLQNIRPRLSAFLEEDKENAYLSQTLARIVTNVKIDCKLKDFEYTFPFGKEVYDFFSEYEFNSLLKKQDLFLEQTEKKSDILANSVEITSLEMLEKQIKHIQKQGVFAFDITSERFSFAYDKNCEFFLPYQPSFVSNVNIEQVFSALKPIFEDEKIKKYGYDIKSLSHELQKFGITLCGASFDALLAFYILTVGERETSKTALFSYFSIDENLPSVSLVYLEEELLSRLEKENLIGLYNEIEFPLIKVLLDMENNGFRIDKETYFALRDRYQEEVKEMEKSVKRLAGVDFNLNSPKQLAELLYDTLGLVTYNNKKRSTSSEFLLELYDVHPVVPAILRYRKVSKFLTTYVEPYAEFINSKDAIVHTIFNQTQTATGRLSSSKPNLQNIPVKDDEGKALRKMFVSRFEDGCLVSADYSQIELRLVANNSGDENLIDAFRNNIDVHSLTASEIFDVPIQEVTDKMRRTAKATNFGIIYGISEFGLSQNINTSRKEAKLYIDKYFEKYPKIKNYMEKNVALAKKTGYSYSLFGRRRKIVELLSSNYQTRLFGERIAMNMPLQGTASDIIKMAMIKVHKCLEDRNMKSKLIMQVHDELIVDCVREEVEEVCRMLRDNMENVASLDVPLLVDVSSGKTWFDC